MNLYIRIRKWLNDLMYSIALADLEDTLNQVPGEYYRRYHKVLDHGVMEQFRQEQIDALKVKYHKKSR